MLDPDKTQPSINPRSFLPTTVAGKPWYEVARDLASYLAVPMMAGILHLSVQNAIRDEQIAQLQREVTALHEQQKEVVVVKEDLQKANLQMVRLEGKIDLTNGLLDQIKTLVGESK